MIPQDLHYDFPYAVYLVPLVIVLVLLFWSLYVFRINKLSLFAIPEIVSTLVLPRSTAIFWSKATAVCLVWCLASLAIMEPVGNGHYPGEKASVPQEEHNELLSDLAAQQKAHIMRRKPHEVVFLMDASASMTVKDTRTGKSRLDYAKEIADEIASRLDGQAASLYAYTSEITQLVPSTMDYLFLRMQIEQVLINEGEAAGTDLGAALKEMNRLFKSEPFSTLKTIILFSDGGDNALDLLQGTELQKEIDKIVSDIGDAADLNLRLFAIGLGSKQGETIPNVIYNGKSVISKLDDALLQKLSRKARGYYYFANSYTAPDLASDLMGRMYQDGQFIEEGPSKKVEVPVSRESVIYDSYYQFPLGCAIILLAFVLFFPDTSINISRRFHVET